MSDIRTWLDGLGLGEYAEAFEAEKVTLNSLPELTDGELKELGLPLGPRKEILKAVRDSTADSEPSQPPAAGDGLAAERRQLTVMFCDLVGSTELSSKLDPEELSELMQAYRKACSDVIGRYDGHVAQYLGDGVMVYFGWPAAHEDDAQRAVRAGLDIVDAVAGLEAEATLAVRIGIATGLVVVGESGADEGADAKLAVGETPNIAARIQGLAAPDTVAIAQNTRRLLGGAFALDDLGIHDVKGVSDGLHVHRVLGAAETESRFDASQGGALTPLVGRENEIAILIERWEQAKDGEGQVVLLSGEAGIGKSRVTQVLRERLADDPHSRLRYQCSPYYSNSAFYPVIVQLERAAGFARNDDVDAKLDKLEALLGQGIADAALIAVLLSLPIDRYPPLALSPQKQKENTIAALAGQVAALAADQPVLMIFEDAHWIDPTTLETIGAVIEAIRDHPVLLVITSRPEFESPWAGHAHVTPLTLGRLGRKLGANMVAKVTGGKALPDEVFDQIVAKTDGIPLFVEELTKTVLEAGFLRNSGDRYELDGPLPALAIPATLQDSLMARLDRLAPVKEVAQIGACIGREFAYELLAEVSPLRDNELEDALQELVNSELIFRRGTPPDATYSFKHALVQDAAYESLLKSRRQQLHAHIAKALVSDFLDVADQQPELVAHQYTAAALADQAIPFWQEAGERAAGRFANQEAVGHLGKALDLLITLPEGTERDRRELALRLAMGPALIAAQGYIETAVEDNFIAARALCQGLGDLDNLAPIWLGLHRFYVVRGELLIGHDGDIEFERLASETGNERLMVTANWALGSSHMWLGNLTDARVRLPEAYAGLAIEDELVFIKSHVESPGVTCRNFHALVETLLGFPDRGLEITSEAGAVSEHLNHPFVSAFAHIMSGVVHQARLEPVASLEHADAALAVCAEHSVPLWPPMATLFRGVALIRLGEIETGLQQLEQEGVRAGVEQLGVLAPFSLVQLGEAMLLIGRIQDGVDAVATAFEIGERIDEGWTRAERHRVRAELLFATGGDKASEAESELLTALKVARAQQAKWYELKAATRLARHWCDQGRSEAARDLLAPVYDWFSEGFDTADLKEAKALLEELK